MNGLGLSHLALFVAIAAGSSVAGEFANGEESSLEIVRATAKKYASIPETPKFHGGRMIPNEGSAFLVVEAEATATFGESGSYGGEVSIESAKGNRRRSIGSLTSARGFDDDDAHIYLAGEGTKSARFRLVFVVPEATTEATFVAGEARAKIEFPDAPVDYPPLGCEIATAKLVSTKLAAAAPTEGRPYALPLYGSGEDEDEDEEYLAPKPSPTPSKMVVLEMLFEQAEPRSEFDDDEYVLWDTEFVAAFEGVRPVSPIEYFYKTSRADAVGRLPAIRQMMTIPVPEGAAEGTLYWRQTPVATFKTP
ncbi:MAG TPA: hypothetical protein VGN57_16995 [Pirellulaceae bacterium]|nr:hypothetical protein [Pirellulaceae bacterium]